MKVLMPFAAAAVVMMGLTACQDGSHEENASASQENGSNSGVTEITFWHSMDSVFGEITQKQVDQFNDTGLMSILWTKKVERLCCFF